MADWRPTSKKRKNKSKGTGARPVANLAHAAQQFDAYEREIIQKETEVASEILSSGKGPRRILEAAGNALLFGQLFLKKRLPVVGQPSPSACHQGCHWCCHLKVEATVPEVLVIATFLREARSPEFATWVSERAAELARDPRVRDSSAKAKARLPCPLLSPDGSCGAYEVRPLACRGWNSDDSESCERGLDDEDAVGITDLALVKECLAVEIGLATALRDHGFPTYPVELTTALDIALRNPDALERWSDGEPLFAAAAVPL